MKRKIIQIGNDGDRMIALADDGTIWYRDVDDAGNIIWSNMDGLPDIEDDLPSVYADRKNEIIHILIKHFPEGQPVYPILHEMASTEILELEKP